MSISATLDQPVATSAPVAKKSYALWRCLALYREMPWLFAITATLFALVNLSLSFQQWLVGRAIHDAERGVAVVKAADGTLNYDVAIYWLLVLGGISLARGILQYIGGICASKAGQDMLGVLRVKIFVQIQKLDLAYHLYHGVGEMVTRTTRDADKVRDALVSFWRQVFETVLVVIASMAILFWYSALLGSVPLLLTIVGLWIFVRQTDDLVALDRAVGEAYDGVNQDLSEGINGVRVIKAFALEPRRIARFGEQVDSFVGHARVALRFASTRIPLPQVVVALGHVWVLGIGSVLVTRGQLNISELVAAMLVINTLVFRIEGVGRVMKVFADARASAARIWELLDATPTIKTGQQAVPAAPLGFQLDNVEVRAPNDGVAILQDISLTIAPGEVVALVGATGSGKSTLASLLPRLVDSDLGAVRVGSAETGWVNVKDLDLNALRRVVHVVPQETFLFSDTLAANLRLSQPGASDAELYAALDLAAAGDFVRALPDGLETRLGDRGMTLSGGQRQRISLARALLARPALLGLDDATSALDAITERTVIDNIRKLRTPDGQAVTVLLVSSKLSTILLADRVLVLSGGSIIASGTPDELGEHNAAYRDLMGLDTQGAN